MRFNAGDFYFSQIISQIYRQSKLIHSVKMQKISKNIFVRSLRDNFHAKKHVLPTIVSTFGSRKI